MGGASVASLRHEPLSNMFNPAHIGFAARDQKLSIEFHPKRTDLLPEFNLDDFYYLAGAGVYGLRLNESHDYPITVGLGYSRLFVNYGEQIVTDETGVELARFDSNEHAHIVTAGVAFDVFVEIGIGVNYKYIISNLSNISGQGTFHSFDVGLLAQLPVFETVAKLTNKSFDMWRISPFLRPSFAHVRANYGGDVSYPGAAAFSDGTAFRAFSDPQPRTARTGIGIDGGLIYKSDLGRFRLVSFEWQAEAEDLLVIRPDRSFTYETSSRINFKKHLWLGQSDQEVITKRGWEVSFADFISVTRGDYKDFSLVTVSGDGAAYKTEGYGVNLNGLVRFLGMLDPAIVDNAVLRFLHDKVNIEFRHAEWKAPYYRLVDGTIVFDTYKTYNTYNSLRISLF